MRVAEAPESVNHEALFGSLSRLSDPGPNFWVPTSLLLHFMCFPSGRSVHSGQSPWPSGSHERADPDGPLASPSPVPGSRRRWLLGTVAVASWDQSSLM